MKLYSTLSASSLVCAIFCDVLTKRAYTRYAVWVAGGHTKNLLLNDCYPGQRLFIVTYSFAITGVICLLVAIVRNENSRYLPRLFLYLLLAVFFVMQFFFV